MHTHDYATTTLIVVHMSNKKSWGRLLNSNSDSCDASCLHIWRLVHFKNYYYIIIICCQRSEKHRRRQWPNFHYIFFMQTSFRLLTKHWKHTGWIHYNYPKNVTCHFSNMLCVYLHDFSSKYWNFHRSFPLIKMWFGNDFSHGNLAYLSF